MRPPDTPQKTAQIRVAIADDNPAVRAALRTYLTENGIRVVAEAENGEQALDCIAAIDLDVLVLDVHAVYRRSDRVTPHSLYQSVRSRRGPDRVSDFPVAEG